MTEFKPDLRWHVRGQCGPLIQVLYEIGTFRGESVASGSLKRSLWGPAWSIHWPGYLQSGWQSLRNAARLSCDLLKAIRRVLAL